MAVVGDGGAAEASTIVLAEGAALGVGCTIGSYYLSKWLNKKLFD